MFRNIDNFRVRVASQAITLLYAFEIASVLNAAFRLLRQLAILFVVFLIR